MLCFCFPLTTGNCSISLPLNNMSHDYADYVWLTHDYCEPGPSPYPFYKHAAPTSCLLLVLPGLFWGVVNLCPFFLLETHGRGNAAQIFCPDCSQFLGKRIAAHFFWMTDCVLPFVGRRPPHPRRLAFFAGVPTHWGRSPLFFSSFSLRIPPFPPYSHSPLCLREGVTPPLPPPSAKVF